MKLISKEVVRRIIDSGRTKEQMLEMVDSAVKIEGSSPDDFYTCDTCKHDSEPWDSDACDGCCKAHSGYEPDDSSTDCISRSEAIRIASGYCHWSRIPEELAKLPSVKPKGKNRGMETG